MGFWKTIPEFPTYEVSETGTIQNIETGHIMEPFKNPRTHVRQVKLRKGGLSYLRSLPRLVLTTHGRPPLDNEIVSHIDGDRDNNAVYNLYWASRSRAWDRRLIRKRAQPFVDQEIHDTITGVTYPNSREAALDTDLPEEVVQKSWVDSQFSPMRDYMRFHSTERAWHIN